MANTTTSQTSQHQNCPVTKQFGLTSPIFGDYLIPLHGHCHPHASSILHFIFFINDLDVGHVLHSSFFLVVGFL